jgi:hypothetical protein
LTSFAGERADHFDVPDIALQQPVSAKEEAVKNNGNFSHGVAHMKTAILRPQGKLNARYEQLRMWSHPQEGYGRHGPGYALRVVQDWRGPQGQNMRTGLPQGHCKARHNITKANGSV